MACYNRGCISKSLGINNQDETRNNGFQLEKFRFRKEIGRIWFSDRVVDEWNRLSNHIVGADTMESFKRRLDKCLDEDNRWNWAAMLIQGLSRAASLIFLCSYVHLHT